MRVNKLVLFLLFGFCVVGQSHALLKNIILWLSGATEEAKDDLHLIGLYKEKAKELDNKFYRGKISEDKYKDERKSVDRRIIELNYEMSSKLRADWAGKALREQMETAKANFKKWYKEDFAQGSSSRH